MTNIPKDTYGLSLSPIFVSKTKKLPMTANLRPSSGNLSLGLSFFLLGMEKLPSGLGFEYGLSGIPKIGTGTNHQ
jgi:hypothetical protein